MEDCPPGESLELLLAEKLGDRERALIEAHVEGCELCQKTLHKLTLRAAGPASSMNVAATAKPVGKHRNPDSEAFFDKLKQMPSGFRTADDATPPPQVRIDGYEILEELGRGAMGVVYRARHLKLNRLVALKVIVTGPHMSADVRQRFKLESQAIARLKHVNIVQVYDVGEHDSLPFLSLELVEGGNLAEWLAGKPRPAMEAAKIIASLAKAVEYAHKSGIIHRDLKPANVLLATVADRPGKRELKITDFGIAKVLPQPGIDDAKMTQTGEILGTAAYMAPEQARGKASEICAATDVYSMGAMLYELLTGRPPFQGATALDTLMQAAQRDPVPISLLVPKVPRDLETICFKCLEKESAKRYPTADALAADLGRFLRNEPIQARPISWVGQSVRWVKRNRGVAAALAGVAFLLVLLAAGSLVTSAYFRTLERQQRTLAGEKTTALDKAVVAETREAKLRQQAVAEGLELRRNVYVDQMNLAGQASMSAGGIGRVKEWLTPWLQSTPDLRNWEWYYLNSLCHRADMTLKGHMNGVIGAKWSPDGTKIASCGSDGTVRIWNAYTGNELHRLYGHDRYISAISWSPDGVRIAAAGDDGIVAVWDVDREKQVMTYHGHRRPLFAVDWSPDGKSIASAGDDIGIQIWDANTGELRCTLNGHGNEVRTIAWSPDGKQLASGSSDATVRIWDPIAGKPLLVMHGHVNLTNCVAWNHAGTRLASGSNDRTIKIWDATTGKDLATLTGHELGVSSIAWSPDDSRLVTGSDDHNVKVWSTVRKKELFTLREHTDPVTSVAWSPDGDRLTSTSFDGTLLVWNASIGAEVSLLNGNLSPVFSVAWSPDGQRLASAGGDTNVRIWNPRGDGAPLVLHGHTAAVRSVAWSPDGKRVASAGHDNTFRIWDAISGQLLRTIPLPAGATYAVAWSPDGRNIAAGGTDCVVRLFDPDNGNPVREYRGHTADVCSISWSPDGTRIATAAADHHVKIWDAGASDQLLELPEAGAGCNCVAWSKDGKRIACGSSDQTVRIWDSFSGKLQFTLRGHSTLVLGIAWSPDGTRIASAGADHVIKLWDTAIGREVLTLNCDDGVLNSVAWSPDGMTLASGADDHAIRIHNAAPGYESARSPQYLPILDRRMNGQSTNAADWRLRTQICASAGDWDGAAASVTRYMELDRRKKWFILGFWVAGPYPEDMAASFAPEHATDPARPMPLTTDSDAPPLMTWQPTPYDGDGFLNFAEIIGSHDHISAYAMLRIYSVGEQQAALLVGSDDQLRIWHNGQQILERLVQRRAIADSDAVPITLTPGWNTLTARVANSTGEHALYVRLSDAPDDLKRVGQNLATGK